MHCKLPCVSNKHNFYLKCQNFTKILSCSANGLLKTIEGEVDGIAIEEVEVVLLMISNVPLQGFLPTKLTKYAVSRAVKFSFIFLSVAA